MANGVTGLSGKNWGEELANQRIDFLGTELKNGGRGLTFSELRDLTVEKVPGGPRMSEKLVKKVVYGVMTTGKVPMTAKSAWETLLPTGNGARKWEEEREKARLSFLSQKDSRARYSQKIKKLGVKTLSEAGVKLCKRGHERTPDNVSKGGGCKKCSSMLAQARYGKAPRKAKKTVSEARMESFEVLPENIRRKMAVAPGEIAESVLLQVDKLRKLMELQQYSRIEIVITGEGQPAVISILPAATPIVVHR